MNSGIARRYIRAVAGGRLVGRGDLCPEGSIRGGRRAKTLAEQHYRRRAAIFRRTGGFAGFVVFTQGIEEVGITSGSAPDTDDGSITLLSGSSDSAVPGSAPSQGYGTNASTSYGTHAEISATCADWVWDKSVILPRR